MTNLTPVQVAQTVSEDGAQRLLSCAVDAASKIEAKMSIAVVDSAGHLLAFRRMDAAALISIDVAIGKARTSAYLGRPTRAFGAMIDEGRASMLSVPNIIPVPGGVPIQHRGVVIGAIGVSGATSDRDDAVARDAAEHFERSLLED